MTRYLIGIDEAGRGPLAGPVAIGVVMVPRNFDWRSVKGVKDSKKLSPRARETWCKKIKELKRDGALNFAVSCASAVVIDRRGIAPAIRTAIARCLARLDVHPRYSEIRLDGSLKAPEHFVNQKTIIGGDDLEQIIAMASVVAKVRRDRYMERMASRFPAYGFEVHKGYGTLVHRTAIKREGLCELHRVTFCRKLLWGSNPV